MKRICLVLFLLVANVSVYSQISSTVVREQTMKIQRLLGLIEGFYVDDSVNFSKLTDDAIVGILSNLDPHSSYIQREELEEANEPLEGGFFGVGIQFNVTHDTLMVMSVISGGPAEIVGLQAGDRIIKINKENVAGVGLTNAGVRSRLKGQKGSVVEVEVLRRNLRRSFHIVRDRIPLYSLDASYMISEKIGYIRIARFAVTTGSEFNKALAKLKAQGMKDLIIDLQDNGGGYMAAAVDVANQLLSDHRTIVYTDGPQTGRHFDYAQNGGLFLNGRVVVLINDGSASASEILSGAVQDWDRGVIVGRRSFGKGLVQRQFMLTDGSAVRLTVSYYYTPSGRCIQKPFHSGENYRSEIARRYSSGELINPDSIHVNKSQTFYTLTKHRKIYGGGGIIPDEFVPIDTGVNYLYYNELIARGILRNYLNEYMDSHRSYLRKNYPTFESYKERFKVSDEMIKNLMAAGEKEELPRNAEALQPIMDEVKLRIKANIAQYIWDSNAYFQIINQDDKIIDHAVDILQNGVYEQILK